MVWLKLVHIAAISVWCAGMLGLPLLFLRRNSVRDEPDLNRLHRLVRRLYVVVMSPAAFLAVASGTGLIFLRATYAPWFGVKLSLVGLPAGTSTRATRSTASRSPKAPMPATCPTSMSGPTGPCAHRS